MDPRLRAIISGGVFHTEAVVSVLYLFRDRWEREVAAGRGAAWTAGLWRRLPPARPLEQAGVPADGPGVPAVDLLVIAGAAWAEAAWGRYWGWDPEEIWAFITWVAYAAHPVCPCYGRWKGRRAAVLWLVAFATFVFNYDGVNILITGLHSYGGLPTR